MNLFSNSDSNKRYYTLDYYYKNKYNSKVFKVSLNGGFTCPNKDGVKGYGGCIYCSPSGSGDYAGELGLNLKEQFNNVKSIIDKKWPNSKYIGYFQANTNTYAPVNKLKELYEEVLTYDKVIGLSIGTRPDAISDDVLAYLSELNTRTDLTVELGLQTIHEKTSKLINRGHDLACFDDMVLKLHDRNIKVVAHIINGLPYETKEMMIDTVNHLNHLPIAGLKIHMLHILKDTTLAKMYVKEQFHVLTKDEYVDIVCDQLEMLKPSVVIHRITGDPKIDDLIEPFWLTKKFGVLNDIDKELARRNTYQGFKSSVLNYAKRELLNSIKHNDLVIDATIGNGNDSLFISKLIANGYLYGFDIQAKALDNTDKLLKENNISNYQLFKVGHEHMLETLPLFKNKVSAIIFNLGYLPNGNKEITTTYKTTLKGINDAYQLLNNKGLLLIIIYPGHPKGLEESVKLKEALKTYNPKYIYNTDKELAPYLIKIKKSV